ncbi:MAG: hypothetical protein AAF762_02235 [Pseudomonadota bacterium]
MKITAEEHVASPKAEVFAALSEFDSLEERLRRKGVPLERQPGPQPPELGTTWNATITWRERRFEAVAQLVSVEPGTSYAFEWSASGLIAMVVIDLIAVGEDATRMIASVEGSASNFRAQVLLQSIALARGPLQNRFAAALAAFARGIDDSA